MKKHKLVLWALAILAILVLVFAMPLRSGSVTGIVNPPGSALRVWIVSATDTFKSSIQNSSFEIMGAKAGIYTLVVDGIAPYHSMSRAGVTVNEGNVTDVGEIIMEQR